MVLIICTNNESNLTIGTEIMFRTDGRTEWTDGRTDDAKTISLRLRRGITNFATSLIILEKIRYDIL